MSKDKSYAEGSLRTDCNHPSRSVQRHKAVSPLAHPPVRGRQWSPAAEALKQVVVLAGFLTRRALKPVLLQRVKCSTLSKKETKPDPAAAHLLSSLFTSCMQRNTHRKTGSDYERVSK